MLSSLKYDGMPSSLSEDNIGALNAIEFTWKIRKYNTAPWTQRYEELKQFKLQKGNCEVSCNYKENPSLGIWVMTQRRQYVLLKKGKPSCMSLDRVEALDAIGFTWQLYYGQSDIKS